MASRKRWSRIGLFLIALAVLVVFFMPFYLVLVNAMKPKIDIIKSPMGWPTSWDFSNYQFAWEMMNYWHGFLNSLQVTVVSVGGIIMFSAMLAYYLCRWETKLNKFILMLLVASMIIPFQVIMIPFVSIYGKLKLLNSKWYLCFYYLGFGTGLATFIYHGFVGSIPKELEEAAIVDGCSPVQTFFWIVAPLLKTTTMTICILDVLWIWNDFLLPSLVLISESQRTLPFSMFYFHGKYTSNYGGAMAALVLSIIPVILFYLTSQRAIINGVIEGAIK